MWRRKNSASLPISRSGKPARLDQEEPVPAPGRRLLVDRLEAVERRHDVERRRALDLVGMVAQQAMGDPRAAVMPGDRELVEAERRHHLDLVERQRPFRIIREIGAGRRFRAVAVAAQIGDDDGEVLGQARRHLAPHHMGLRVAVQQQQRRAAAAGHEVDRRARGLDPALGEAGKKSAIGFSKPLAL